MDFLRDWILGITGAALAGSLAMAVAPEGSVKRVVRLCAALLLALAIAEPLLSFGGKWDAFEPDLAAYAMGSENITSELLGDIIARDSGAYIVSKAQALGLVVTAEVQCRTGEFYPEPHGVTVGCNRPEHAKNALRDIIAADLGIPAERQRYIETKDSAP